MYSSGGSDTWIDSLEYLLTFFVFFNSLIAAY